MTQKPNIVFLLNNHQAFYGHGEMVGGPKIFRPNFEKLAQEGIEEDPFELNNLINDENWVDVLADMKNRLEKWRQKTNDTMTRKIIRKDRMRFAKEHMDNATLFDF